MTFFLSFKFFLKTTPVAHIGNFKVIEVPSRFVKKNVVFLVGRSSAAPMSSAAPKKKHLIEAAPFSRLDQMLRTTV